jgi:hypothetical protein
MGKKAPIHQTANQNSDALENTTPEQREVVADSSHEYSNGNRTEAQDQGAEKKAEETDGGGGAEKGGPDLDKAQDRQPPEATR